MAPGKAANRSRWSGLLRSWRTVFALDPAEASFDRRGFSCTDAATRRHFEQIGEIFIAGFNKALVDEGASARSFISRVDSGKRGFAVEGAAMGAAVADALVPGSAHLRNWRACVEEEFTYLAHVGAGWALARVPWRKSAILAALDPIHYWLAFDGLGFHDGYFKSRAIVPGWRRITQGYAARVYDQGVGRALWFISGGDVGRAASLIGNLEPVRRSDLWSGLGLAITYAGPAKSKTLAQAVESSHDARASLALGAAFAAEARARARHVPDHTTKAVRILTGLDVDTVVQRVRQARTALPSAESSDLPRYERWRRDVQAALCPT
jgi:hypothetical protein